eukprot:8442389-Karenia_brevis.AAC.1
MEGAGEMPDISPSPCNSPPNMEWPDGPVSPEPSFLEIPLGVLGGESSGGGDVVAPQGLQYP